MDELDSPSAGDELIMLVLRTLDAAMSMIKTSAVECNAAELLRETGHTVIEVTEDTTAQHLITLQDWIDFSTAFAIFGQFALVIYKNIDDRSYMQSMQRREAALKSVAGVVGDLVPGGGDILLSISTAKNIRTIVGGNDNFRAELLNAILGNRDGLSLLNNVCNHLAEFISWTEIALVKFMYKSLCLTDSPVLWDSRVKHEVIILCEAYERINVKPYPQYYQILQPDEVRVTIARSRFKTLAEVARRYLSEQNRTVSQFAASSNTQNTLVNDLLSIHRAYMNRGIGAYMPRVQGDDDISRAIRYLTTNNIDEAIRFLTTFDLYEQ